ncbi:hypothetical protein DRW03_15860 [Corallococcus sp. H22C18031201]|nr:hypothetical protein DRW03_15860 [Corallococcus sp. H22C18031201]
MRSRFVPVIAANADVDLTRLVPMLVQGPPVGWAFARACRGYRIRGGAGFLLSAKARDLHVDLHRSGAAHAFYVSQVPEHEQVTSRAAPFFDALACGDDASARSIARHAPTQAKLDREHVDDFLYVHLLMRHCVLGGSRDEALDILTRWEDVVAEESASARLDVCRALLAGNAVSFHTALLAMAEEHRAFYDLGFQKSRIPEETWAIEGCLFIEGMALWRLARAARLDVAEDYPLMPSLALRPPKLSYSPDAWRTP